MVVFTCNHCGDSLQKPKAEKHYETKCRNNYPNLCCVDCLKDFRGDEFKAHTKCVSEAERYGGNGFVAKPNQNKGEKKQNAWIEIVQLVLNENKKLPGSLRNLLERISIQPNTPRKKPKFYNFVRSMDSKVTMKDIEAAWELLSAKLSQLVTVNAANKQIKNAEENDDNAKTENGTVKEKKNKKVAEVMDDEAGSSKENGVTKKQKKKKQKGETNEHPMEVVEDNKNDKVTDDTKLSKKERKEQKKREKYEAELKEAQTSKKCESSNVDDDTKQSRKRKLNEESEEKPDPKQKKVKKDAASEFNWKEAILSVLGSKGNDVSLKKLQKRVFSEYCSENNTTEVAERIVKKFQKTLFKIPNVKVENGKVVLTMEEE